MTERTHWHPVAACDDIAQQPRAARLLGEDLVLWRDAQGAVHAWPDRCPHRGAKLSLGRLEAGRLECPYHGWQFDASGRCVHVPALPSFAPPATHRVATFETREAQGLVKFIVLRRQKDDRHRTEFADASEKLHSIHLRHLDIEHTEVRLLVRKGF